MWAGVGQYSESLTWRVLVPGASPRLPLYPQTGNSPYPFGLRRSVNVTEREGLEPSILASERGCRLQLIYKFNNLPRGVRCNLAARSTTEHKQIPVNLPQDSEGPTVRNQAEIRRGLVLVRTFRAGRARGCSARARSGAAQDTTRLYVAQVDLSLLPSAAARPRL